MAEETTTQTPPDLNPLGHMLEDYQNWVNDHSEGEISVDYDDDDDSFRVVRQGRNPVVVYSSEIDHQFYHEGQAVFIEAEVGPPNEALNLADVMRFSGDELVLSRISLSERGEDNYVLVVEAALPTSLVEFTLLDLLIREVATISNDIRKQLVPAADEPTDQGADSDSDQEPEESEDHSEP